MRKNIFSVERKLEIGPGKDKIDKDWTTVNIVKTPCTDIIAEWGKNSLPFRDGEFDLVYSSHCLEHIPWHMTLFALKDVYRILKKCGTIEIWVPDFKYIVDCYLNRRCGDKWRKYNSESHFMKWVNGRIFTYGDNPHFALFDMDYLEHCLCEAGFKNIDKLDKPRAYDHGRINIGLKGEKC